MIHHGQPPEGETHREQAFGVAREGDRIARNIGHAFGIREGDLVDLRLRTGAWGIQHDDIELIQLIGQKRAAEQIARLGGDALEALGRAPSGVERTDHRRL